MTVQECDESCGCTMYVYMASLHLQVTVMVDSGKELGISIRGGSEHGLGIYVSKVDEASVAEAYGIKVQCMYEHKKNENSLVDDIHCCSD